MRRQAAAAPRRRRARATSARSDSRLTRERILAAGLELLVGRGVAGVSMRALAEALGTAPMSLYRHVHSKDDLLSGIVAMVLERLDLDVSTRGAWAERAAAWMHSLRTQLRRSPAVVSILIPHGHYAPALSRATNTLLRILREAGFDGPDAVRACREIMWTTLAFVSAEIRGPAFSPSFYMQALGGSDRAAGPALPPEDVAEIAALMPHFLSRDLDVVFAGIVTHLLSGLEVERAHRAGHRAHGEPRRLASRGRRR